MVTARTRRCDQARTWPPARGVAALVCLLSIACVAQEKASPPTGPQLAPEVTDLAGTLGAAEKAARRGKVLDGAKLFDRLFLSNEKDARPLQKKVDFLLRYRYLNDALDAAQAALEKFPKDLELLTGMALACQRKAEEMAATKGGGLNAGLYLEDAIDYAGKAIAVNPNKREPKVIRGLALYALGRKKEARVLAADLMKRHGHHPSGFLLMGQILFDDYQKGVTRKTLKKEARFRLVGELRRILNKAAELDKSRYTPHRRLADLAAWEGELDQALGHYAEALARNPKKGAPFDWLAKRATPVQRTELLNKAIARFHELGVAEKKLLADLEWQRGLATFEAKDWKLCVESLTRAFQIRSDYLNALYYGGLASYELGKHEQALFLFTVFARKSPGGFVQALQSSGDSGKAYAAILRYLAGVANRKNDAAASRDLNRVLAEYEDDVDAWNNYAFLCRETRAYEKSWTAYNEALRKSPKDPQILNDAAVILQYHLHRELGKAERMYQQAIREAKKLLRNKKIRAAARARATTSLRDATMNLKKLREDRKGKKGK